MMTIQTTGVTGTYKSSTSANYIRDHCKIHRNDSGLYSVDIKMKGGVDEQALVMIRECINRVIGSEV